MLGEQWVNVRAWGGGYVMYVYKYIWKAWVVMLADGGRWVFVRLVRSKERGADR